jgi:hypothetical protein
MIRFLYVRLLRLHPRSFRTRFGDEMLSIFDQSQGKCPSFRLLLDALHSLFCQWMLRPEFLVEAPSNSQPALDGVPSFSTLDPFRPRASAVVPGLLLSIAVFCLTCVAIKYSWIRVLNVHIPEVQFEAPQWIPPSRAEAALPQTPAAAPAPTQPIPAQPATVPLPAKLPPHPQPIATTLRKLASRALAGPQKAKGAQEADVSRQSPPVMVKAESPLQIFEGTYEIVSPQRITVLIAVEDDRLTMTLSGQPKHTLAQVSQLKFQDSENKACTIEFASAGIDVPKIDQLDLFLNGQHFTARRR